MFPLKSQLYTQGGKNVGDDADVDGKSKETTQKKEKHTGCKSHKDDESQMFRRILSGSGSPLALSDDGISGENKHPDKDKTVSQEIFFYEDEDNIYFNMGSAGQEVIKKNRLWMVVLECTDKGTTLTVENKFWLIFDKGLKENSIRIPCNTNIVGHQVLWQFFRRLQGFNWDVVQKGLQSEAENKNFICYIDNVIYDQLLRQKQEQEQLQVTPATQFDSGCSSNMLKDMPGYEQNDKQNSDKKDFF